MRWEYKAIPVTLARNQTLRAQGGEVTYTGWVAQFTDRDPLLGFEEVCDFFGASGWELTSSVVVDWAPAAGNAEAMTLFFKRQRP